MKRIVLIGGQGQLATCLREQPCHWAEIIVLARPSFDLANTAAIAPAIAALNPDLVINASAYTAVDKAESEPDLAHLINAVGSGEIARGAAMADAPVIHVSTDYVFDGSGVRPYFEDDPTGPLGVYGRTKLEGEVLVAQENPRHLIIRTAWVYSAHGANFVKSMLRFGAERDRLTIVSDQIGCPTSAHDLASIILTLGERLVTEPNEADYGPLHVCGTGIASWFDLAKAVFRHAEGIAPLVVPITTADYPTPAKRPANSRLDMTRLERHFGLVMPEWTESLARVVKQLTE